MGSISGFAAVIVALVTPLLIRVCDRSTRVQLTPQMKGVGAPVWMIGWALHGVRDALKQQAQGEFLLLGRPYTVDELALGHLLVVGMLATVPLLFYRKNKGWTDLAINVSIATAWLFVLLVLIEVVYVIPRLERVRVIPL